jgi:hypothetical protein
MRLGIATDHVDFALFALKKSWLPSFVRLARGGRVRCGCIHTCDDYPDIVIPLARPRQGCSPTTSRRS